MACKPDPHQIPDLAFGPGRAGKDTRQTGNGGPLVVSHGADHHQMLLAGVGTQLVDGVETLVADRQLRTVDRRNIDQRLVAQLRILADKLGQRHQLAGRHVDNLLAVVQASRQQSRTKAFDNTGRVRAFPGRQRGHRRDPQRVEAGQRFVSARAGRNVEHEVLREARPVGAGAMIRATKFRPAVWREATPWTRHRCGTSLCPAWRATCRAHKAATLGGVGTLAHRHRPE